MKIRAVILKYTLISMILLILSPILSMLYYFYFTDYTMNFGGQSRGFTHLIIRVVLFIFCGLLIAYMSSPFIEKLASKKTISTYLISVITLMTVLLIYPLLAMNFELVIYIIPLVLFLSYFMKEELNRKIKDSYS